MQPKKQLKAQYIGIFEEIDSFYWPKMHFGQCPKVNVFFSMDLFPKVYLTVSWPNCRLQCWCWENHYLFPHFLPKTWPSFFDFSIEPYVLFFIKWGWGDSWRICVQVPSWEDELQLAHVRSTSCTPTAAAIFTCQGHKNNLHTTRLPYILNNWQS